MYFGSVTIWFTEIIHILLNYLMTTNLISDPNPNPPQNGPTLIPFILFEIGSLGGRGILILRPQLSLYYVCDLWAVGTGVFDGWAPGAVAGIVHEEWTRFRTGAGSRGSVGGNPV